MCQLLLYIYIYVYMYTPLRVHPCGDPMRTHRVGRENVEVVLCSVLGDSVRPIITRLSQLLADLDNY